MAETLQQVWTAVEEATEDLRESWEADDVDVHGSGYTLRWDNEAEPVDNVHAMVEEMRTLADENPDAEIQGRADAEGYQVSAWFRTDEEDN